MGARQKAAARLAAVQALYQMDVASKGLNEIFAEFESFWMGQNVEGDQYEQGDAALFRDIVQGVVDEQRAIDRITDAALSSKWPLKRIEAVMRAVLRAGTYELRARADIPARVVIKEYVDVAAAFLAQDETGMINAVLDHLARELRQSEFSASA